MLMMVMSMLIIDIVDDAVEIVDNGMINLGLGRIQKDRSAIGIICFAF